MDGQLTEAQKATRSDQMLALNEKHAVEYEEAMIGKQLRGASGRRDGDRGQNLVCRPQQRIY